MVPFLRSKKLSNHFASTNDVIIDCVKKISHKNNSICCCIYPKAVLINKSDLIFSYKKIKKLYADLLGVVTKYHDPPLRCFEKKIKLF
jgi:CMP-N-acetylneuraminic acid synthetase